MKALFNELEFSTAKSYDKLPCQCKQCEKTFYLTKKRIQDVFNPNKLDIGDFCSMKCWGVYERTRKQTTCANCGKNFSKLLSQQKSTKGNDFCTKSCAATYNNTHKTTGNRRSKLEIYLEQELPIQFPLLEIHYNKKDAINSELDIYIPSLKLAFELNGIFHYEPIYGTDKLSQIQNNDTRKFQACIERGIEMCIVDASGLKYFKPDRANKYLQIIINIINIKMSKNY